MSELKHILLIVGAVVIVGPAFYTLRHLNDRVVFTVLLPGIVVGLVLVGVATVLRKKTKRGSGGQLDAF